MTGVRSFGQSHGRHDYTCKHTDGGEREVNLRDIFAQSPSFSALLHGPEHRFVLTNPAYQQLIGHRDVIGLTVREAIPEVESQGFLDLLDEVFATGKPFIGRNVEIVLQRTPGGAAETRFLDFVYQPIRDESGNVTSIFVEGSDITERHATEDALRASEARLRELNLELERRVVERAQARSLTWQLSPDLLGALNSKGYFETSNPAWEAVLGWSEAEVASMSIFELLHPDDLEHTRAGFELTQVRSAGDPFRQPLSMQGWQLPLDFLGWHSGRRLCVLHRSGHHGRASGGNRACGGPRGPSTISEDGSDRPAHGRHRPRLQQPFDRHHRLARYGAQAHGGKIGSDEIPRFMDAASTSALNARRRSPIGFSHSPAANRLTPGRTISTAWSRAWKTSFTAPWASRSSCSRRLPPTSGPPSPTPTSSRAPF